MRPPADPGELLSRLSRAGQAHVVDRCTSASYAAEDRRRLRDQLERLDQAQGERGLDGYLARARELLAADAAVAAADGNAAHHASSQQQQQHHAPVLIHASKLGTRLRVNTPRFEEAEELGAHEAPYLAFVVVAGGLGERLNGTAPAAARRPPQVKALLPAELVTGKCFLELQCDYVAAAQLRARVQTGDAALTVPLAVMTSDDTHDAVMAHLTGYQGPLSEITVMKQEKVACLASRDAALALDPADPFRVACKPHGHGDVHTLLHKSELAHRWAARGVRWVVFLQDSNALATRAVCAAVGNSVRSELDVNMVAVARRAGEAIGAICDVVDTRGVKRTLNVEYNLLQRYFGEREDFAAGAAPGGVAADDAGFGDAPSPYPGNVNVLVLRCAPYAAALAASQGVVPEFVNPKCAPDGRSLASPVRLECMMQDAPLLFPGTGAHAARVGFTELDRFLCFSAVKNSLKDALVKLNRTGFPESASSAESDVYAAGRRLLAMAGCNVRTTGLPVRRFAGLPFEDGAKVVLGPDLGVTVAEVRSRFPFPDHVSVTERSTLVVDGNVEVHSLVLDGALVVRAGPGARVTIKNLTVVNQGWVFEALEEDEFATASPVEALRGYRKRELESLTVDAPNPGDVVVDRP